MPVYAVFGDEVIWIQLHAQVQVHGWCIWVVVFVFFLFCCILYFACWKQLLSVGSFVSASAVVPS